VDTGGQVKFDGLGSQ